MRLAALPLAACLAPALALLDAPAPAAETPPPSAQLEDPKSADVEVSGHILEPRKLEPTEERIAQLRLPEGFEIGVFARDLVDPRMLAVTDQAVYATRREVGDVVMLKDEDGDGRADSRQVVANRPNMHGIWIEDGTAWLVTVKDVYRAPILDDGSFGALERLIDDLPEGGQHPNRTLALGPDGKLYVSVGSTCNACGETSQENATLLRAEPDGSRRGIFASGLRNTIGFGWHPATGELWGFDHGIDWLGDHEQVEELNRLEQGRKYGWPYVYGDGKLNPQDEPPGGIAPEQWAADSEPPVLGYTAHAAPMQLAFHDGAGLPAEYRGDAFVAMRGSWNRRPPSGYEVLRIDFDEAGRPQGFESFLTGFLVETDDGSWGQFARLAGLAVGPGGALYLSDDSGGVVYRIAYTGAGATAAAAEPPPDEGGEERRAAGGPDGLAIEAVAPPQDARFKVTSPAFDDGQPIPETYAAEGEDISPPLSWWGAPEAAEAFVVLVEDPDAGPGPPFVHWILANLPWRDAGVAQGLPGGLPTAPKLALPEGALQGTNSKGATGWTGMAPPPEDGPHRYHFQVFALDRPLELAPGADRKAVLEAMHGRVIAAGELVGTYDR